MRKRLRGKKEPKKMQIQSPEETVSKKRTNFKGGACRKNPIVTTPVGSERKRFLHSFSPGDRWQKGGRGNQSQEKRGGRLPEFSINKDLGALREGDGRKKVRISVRVGEA